MSAQPAIPTPSGWRWAPAWVLAFVALWPARGVAEAVLVVGALLALAKLLASRFRGGGALLSGHAWALTSTLFFAYWLPQLFSTVDTVDAARSLRKVLVGLIYLPFLWLVASAVATQTGRRKTFAGLAIIVLVWTLDALCEAIFGTSPIFWLFDHAKIAISGHSMCTADEVAAADRLGGVLGACNLKLGIVLASLSPFALAAARQKWGALGWLITATLIGLVVLLAGSRASWLTYAIVLVWTGWSWLGWRKLVLLLAGGVLVLGIAGVASPQVGARLQRTALALTGSSAGVDEALSGRSQIWSAALCMVREHPINGVGVRGFRDAFPGCDPTPEQAPAWGEGAAYHAHQIVLEVLSETGGIGLLFWLLGVALAWRAWRYAEPDARERARPAMLALAASVFPLNTHLAAYSTFWGSVLLLLMGLYAGSLCAQEPAEKT